MARGSLIEKDRGLVKKDQAEVQVYKVQVDEAWLVDKALTKRVSIWEARDRLKTM